MEMEEKRPIDDVEAGNAEGNSAPPSYGTGGYTEPPTYQQATEPPPSYQSLFGEIKEARQSASSVFDFLKKLLILLIGTIGCTIALGIIMAIPISMIAIGATYKHDCPTERYIPIYLIVGGSFGIVRNFISLCKRAKRDQDDESESKQSPILSILDCFLFAWFIAGNVWIYSNYKPSFEKSSGDRYCDKTLYLFAFWLTNATYILIGVTCLCMCCAGVCAAVMG
ncbi:transmembrane protein 272-like isoform X2 [Actinia tenebrosa]|uniref:Transmembrane protein 272-like isoform X2 n=1 Tax=Actinia tenebrosa TaxID=6105 RepID=A0A6P8HHV9_ACTTE|nr:transmembrane protein 272-like isoform X2 [Actinia tenebrosa]